MLALLCVACYRQTSINKIMSPLHESLFSQYGVKNQLKMLIYFV